MSDQFFGWELLFNNVKNKIKKKEDVLILLIYFSLIRAGFKCVGVNNEWKADQLEFSSELLPKEWNANKEYVLRYKHNDEKFVLRSCHFDSNTMIFNFVHTAKLKVSNVMINYEDSVKALEGNMFAVLPDHKDLIEAIQRDLIASFVTPEKKNADTKTTSDESTKSTRVDPLLVGDCRSLRDIEPCRIPDINNFGRTDLDPFAAMGRNDPVNPINASQASITDGGELENARIKRVRGNTRFVRDGSSRHVRPSKKRSMRRRIRLLVQKKIEKKNKKKHNEIGTYLPNGTILKNENE